ncbi:hypothetical protein OGAPHI_007204 [Ogataea philodendri]|uniref:Hap4 transcription factor heteromerisation domain-containing protein n=1 Tax=Ogataea philodendri TaxID=1378263 RepID=A0A9P8NVW9_9ASCO|nr:uncharacterized protein OGAPHI_007204 [Ogataea philodendri]KAH3659999.1 hypothetical protein OGAPHI_007204 [Ogataea philodendri]
MVQNIEKSSGTEEAKGSGSTRMPLHPIAIKPKPSGTSSSVKSVQMSKGTSTAANKGSDEIVLTTSKNWILPPRPKIKKGKAHKASSESVKKSDKTEKPEKFKFNSQIHSNINLYTNNQLDLKLQLQNVTKENDNLKKILAKVNKEIHNLRLAKGELQSSVEPIDLEESHSMASRTPSVSESNEAITIDPINLSYNLENKRVKKNGESKKRNTGVVGVGIGPLSELSVSSKDILMSTAKSKKKTDSKANEVSQKAQMLLAEQMRQKQLLLEKQRQEQTQKQFHPCGVCLVTGSCMCGDLNDVTNEWLVRGYGELDLLEEADPLLIEPASTDVDDEFKFNNDFMMYE